MRRARPTAGRPASRAAGRPVRRAAPGAAVGAALGAALAACGDPAGVGPCAVTLSDEAAVLVAGTSGRAPAQVVCAGGDTPPALRWTSSDTSIATVDSTGRVTGHAPGQVRLVATLPTRTPARAELALQVVPPYVLVVTPSPLVLAPRQRAVLNVSAIPTPLTPPGFSRVVEAFTSDSCVARLEGAGTVAAGVPGSATLTVRLRDAPGVRVAVPTVVQVPRGWRLAIATVLGAGPSPAPLDLTQPVRGTITVVAGFDYAQVGPDGGRVEFRLGGQLVGTTLLGASPTGGSGPVVVSRTIDTAARDPILGPRFANGPQQLEVALVLPPVAGFPGCPAFDLSDRTTLPLTLANP